MSDFFAGLGAGFRFPDTQMNSGPLPSIGAGAPAGAGGDPDGRINFNSTLLEGITPYSYAKGARVGSDRNYQQVPHRIQQIVHQIWLPSGKCPTEKINVSHVVDQGDIAFVINSDNNGFLLFPGPHMCASDKDRLARHPVFANLATVNYILAGVQRVRAVDPQKNYWKTLRSDLGMRDVDGSTNDFVELDSVLQLVKTRLIPYGICAGSEKQGGQTETGMSPVQAGVNFVTTMTVDGQNIDLINYWAHENLSAGDQLIFKLERKDTYYYGLNHYYKETRDQTFSEHQMCWQLVPSVFRMGQVQKDSGVSFDYRTHGYWRIAQLMQSRKQCSNNADEAFYWNDDKNNLRSGGSAQLLQVLFAPVYKDMSVSDMPIFCTLFDKVETMSLRGRAIETKDYNKTAFNCIVRDIRYKYEMTKKRKKNENKKQNDELLEQMRLIVGDDTALDDFRKNVKSHEEKYFNEKKEIDDKFQQDCIYEVDGCEIFGMNEDECLALDMTCIKKCENIIAINSDPFNTLYFKGVDFSGLSVELLRQNIEYSVNPQLNMDFIRPDTFILDNSISKTSKYISNTVNRNICTRYNDQILMGFLIQNVVKNIKNTCFLRCEVIYNVVMEKIRLKIDEGDMFSEMYQFKTTFQVRLFDYVKCFPFTGYENKKTFDVVVMDLGDNNLKYIQTDEDDLRKRIEVYQNKTPINERESHFDEENNFFVVDIKKFVLDYARQISFFEEECEYENDFENALTSKDISIIDGNVKNSEYVYIPKRTIEERKMVNERYMETMGKYRNRKSFEASKINKDDAYYKDIDEITKKDLETLGIEDIQKYFNYWLNMNKNDKDNLNENERKIYGYVVSKNKDHHEEAIKRLAKITDIPSGAGGGAGGGPPLPETTPGANGNKPTMPASTPSADPVQAVPTAAMSAAAQPAAKRSKVSLARQQAANAPMDAT